LKNRINGCILTIRHFGLIMKTARLPAIVFALLLTGYVVFLVCTTSLLPPQMATHFDASGRPNGWMSRSSAVDFQGVIGLILPLMIAAAFWAIKFAPTRGLNFPRRDFWFAPERRDETCAYLSRQGFWFASLLVGLQALVWCQLIASNRMSVPHLPTFGFLTVMVVFGVSMIVWVMRLFHHFSKPPSAAEPAS
jgi:uncharacterized membrane protein